MPWVRRRYRGNKVWIETRDDGGYVLDERGLARLRYKPDDDRTYSVRPGELADVDAAPAPAQETPPARSRAARPAKPRAPAVAVETTEVPEAEAADADLPALVGREVQAWTDGASSGNPGPSGAGVVLLFREHRKEASVYLGETTNNVAELTAVLEALRLVRRDDMPVRVFTDSSYAIGVLSGSMRAKANVALVAEIQQELARFRDVRLVKVLGHSGVEGNERADALARLAIKTKRTAVTSTPTG